jgi:very-short-patch-repair endonuclease
MRACSKHSEETKEKMRQSALGRKHPQWVKDKIANSMKGFKHSKETKEKMRLSATGRKLSECTKEKIKLSHVNCDKSRYENWIRAGHAASNVISSIEIKVGEQLNLYGIRFVQQKKLFNGMFFVDFWLPEYQLVIECNGDYWHSLPEKIDRDKRLEEYVLSKGKDILWLWEHEINDEWFDIADYLEI